MTRTTFEQRRNNSDNYCIAFTTANQHSANVLVDNACNKHLTYIGPMSDILNVCVTVLGQH